MKQFRWRADLRNPDLEVVAPVCQVACCYFQNYPKFYLFIYLYVSAFHVKHSLMALLFLEKKKKKNKNWVQVYSEQSSA